MFADRDLLIKEFSKLVGIFQSNSSDYPSLAPSLVSSNTRRYVDQTSELINIEYITNSKRNFSVYPYPAWGGSGVNYEQKTVVKESGVYYEAIQDVPTTTLITDTAYWFELSDIDLYLLSSRESAIDTALDTVFNDKKSRQKVKSIYENIALFKGVASITNKQTNNDNFVGIRVRVKTDRDLVTVVNKISHQFSEAVNFNLHVYHSSEQEPLLTIPIVHTRNNSSQWTVPSDFKIRYISDDYDAGGEFYIGYAQSELGTSQALINTSIDWYNGMCCGNAEYWNKYSKYISLTGFSVPESSFTVGVDMFDVKEVTTYYNNNFGLNLNITTQCDLTPFFIQQSNIFAEAINYQWGLNILRGFASNTRGTNTLANQVAEKARDEIFTYPDAKGTLLDRTNMALKGLNFDLSGLQSECLTCKSPVIRDGRNTFKIVFDNPLGV